jgi:hypothetical protein
MKENPYLRHLLVWEFIFWPCLLALTYVCARLDPLLALAIVPTIWQGWDFLVLRRLSYVRASIEINQRKILLLRRTCGFMSWAANMAYWGGWSLVLGVRMNSWHGWVIGGVIGLMLGPVLGIFLSSRRRTELSDTLSRGKTNSHYRHMGTVHPPGHPDRVDSPSES